MALLVEYEWPGNVRELENVIQGAIIMADEDTIHPRNLPAAMQQPDLLGLGDSLPGDSFEDDCRITKSNWHTGPFRNATATRRWRPAVCRYRGLTCIGLSATQWSLSRR